MAQTLQYFEQLMAKLQHKNQYEVVLVAPDIYRIMPRLIASKQSIALVALTHGDEVIGLHIFNELILKLLENKFRLKAELYLILANRFAYLKQQRYVDVDLNRIYAFKGTPKLLEERRVQAIRPIIDTCDYIIDLHQSIEDTLHPFFVLPFSQNLYKWVSGVAPAIPIVARQLSKTVTTLTTYGVIHGKKAVTFEVGGSGVDHAQLECGLNTISQFLEYMDGADSLLKNNVPSLKAPIYDINYFEPYLQGQVQFVKRFVNFESIAKGQVVAVVEGKEIKSPLDGNILVYPRKWFDPESPIKADGLFFVIQERK